MKSITIYKGKYPEDKNLIGVYSKKDDNFCRDGDCINKIIHYLYGHHSYYSEKTDTLYVGTNVSVNSINKTSKKTKVYDGDGISPDKFIGEYPSISLAFRVHGALASVSGINYNRDGYKYIEGINKSFVWV